jgi:hypothetical protein
MDNGPQGSVFRVILIDNFKEVGSYQAAQTGLEAEFSRRGLTTSASRRDTFELRLRQGHVSFTMPQYGIVLADANVPGLTWSRGVVQLGHHSYNPTKDCTPSGTMTCQADTWHWDNLSVSPALPFTILRPDRRAASAAQPTPLTLAAPAPAGASLRFMGIGNSLEVSYDGGATWRAAVLQGQSKSLQDEIFKSYWMPIPAGTTRVQVRGGKWWGGQWEVRDLSVWSRERPAGAVTETVTGAESGPEAMTESAPEAMTESAPEAMTESGAEAPSPAAPLNAISTHG